MKKNLVIIFLLFFLAGFKNVEETISLKIYAEEAMKKSLIGSDPIIVITHVSVKIYSKIDLNHPIFNNLNKKGLFIIPQNSDLIEEFYGKNGKINGAIVYLNANESKPDLRKLRFVLNGKEISGSVADTLNMGNVNGYVCLRKRQNKKCVVFISTNE